MIRTFRHLLTMFARGQLRDII